MATVSTKRPRQFEYPTSDGKPMAETDFHRDLMLALIETLKAYFAAKSKVYVSGNLLIYYEPGNKRKHVSPDVFVVPGVPKKDRLYYLTWDEGKNLAFVIEITSSSTKREDKGKKFALYRDVLNVTEYFLFDPFGEYLKPQLQGYCLRNGDYIPIPLTEGRMASQVTGLHLEPAGQQLRLFDPKTKQRLLTPMERAERAEQRALQADSEIARLAAENERQRQLLEKLMREKKNGH